MALLDSNSNFSNAVQALLEYAERCAWPEAGLRPLPWDLFEAVLRAPGDAQARGALDECLGAFERRDSLSLTREGRPWLVLARGLQKAILDAHAGREHEALGALGECARVVEGIAHEVARSPDELRAAARRARECAWQTCNEIDVRMEEGVPRQEPTASTKTRPDLGAWFEEALAVLDAEIADVTVSEADRARLTRLREQVQEHAPGVAGRSPEAAEPRSQK
jgi:hypothetical protein